MAYRVLEVTLLSAQGLKNVNLITRMEVYAVATISCDPITRQCTPPDPYGGRHPSWNATLRFTVPPTAEAATGCLHILLRAERALKDRDVGEVIVPLADILAGACAGGDLGPRPPQLVSYHVRKVHRAETCGVLHLSYRLGPVVAPKAPQPQNEPVVTHPVGWPIEPTPYPDLPTALLPPPPRVAGHVAAPPPPRATGHVALSPSPPHAAGHVAAPPPPRVAHVAAPQPPKIAGHVDAKLAGHEATSPRKTNNNCKLEFEMGLGVVMVGGANRRDSGQRPDVGRGGP